MGIFDLDAGSDRFNDYLDLTQNEKSGTWFNPWMEFTEDELNRCEFLQPVCRGPVFAETDADHHQTRKWLDESPKVKTFDGFAVKLLDRVCVKDRKLKPNEIAGVLQWTPEFILPQNIVEIFRKSALDGFSVKEVWNRKAKATCKSFHLLYSDHFMPAASVEVEPPKSIPFAERFEDTLKEAGISKKQAEKIEHVDDNGFRLYGCLCYESLDKEMLKDFNRTAEPWASNDFPLWVVSQRVRALYRDHKFKGWIFEPVLEKDNPLYEEHNKLWGKFLNAIQCNRANHI